MNNRIKAVLLSLTVILLIAALTACVGNTGPSDEEDATVASLALDAETLPSQLVSGRVDFSGMMLNVYYSDGETVRIPVTEDMVAERDRNKLNLTGTQTVTLIYGGKSLKVNLTLVEPEVVVYTLTLRINKPVTGESEATEYLYQTINVNYDPVNLDNNRRTIVAPNFSSEGLAFEYWKEGGENISSIGQTTIGITVDRNRTITAYYKEMQYKVSFNSNGGSDISQIETREISYANMPVPVREGYVFVGWKDTDLREIIRFDYIGTDITKPANVTYTGEPFAFASQYYYRVRKNVTLEAQWEELGLQFENYGSGLAVVGYNYTGNRTYLEIPATYQTKPIQKLAATAFGKKNQDDTYDYTYASKLITIKISNQIETIEPFAFSNCIALKSIQLDASNTHFTVKTNGALYGASNTLLAYPAGKMMARFDVDTSRIVAGAFENANIGSINVENSLIELGDRAFNSRTIDNVNFGNDLSSLTTNPIDLFSSNINKIYVRDSSYKTIYINHQSFAPYANKITEITEGTTHVAIYQNLLYRRLEGIDRKMEIIGADRSITTLTIPVVSVDGYFFTSIGKYAFSYCYGLTIFNLPQEAKIERILEGAFENTAWQNNPENTAIRNGLIIINNILYLSLNDSATVSIPFNVTKIAEESFINSTNLRTIIFETQAGNTQISDIERYAFANCTALETFTLPKTVMTIGDYAFMNTRLDAFAIEANSVLKNIGSGAFHNAKGLSELKLPSTIEEIADGAFTGCISLESIKILATDEKNDYFKTVDGVLYKYNKDLPSGQVDNVGEILHTYPSAKMLSRYEVAAGTKRILEYAFYYSNIGSLIIPSSVTSIAGNAIVVPQLVYVEFEGVIPVARWQDLLGLDMSGKRFTPSFIFIQGNDNSKYDTFMQYRPSSLYLAKWKADGVSYSNVDMNIDPDELEIFATEYMMYLEVSIGGNTALGIIGAKRTVAEIDYEASHNATNIAGYAFISAYLTSVTLSSSVNTIEAYAFYHSPALKKVTLKAEAPPALAFANGEVVSFHPDVIIANALVYVPEIALSAYIAQWPTEESFVLVEGTFPQVTFYLYEGVDGQVIYNAENASLFQLVFDPQTINALPVITRPGYDFAGWYEDSEYEGETVVFPYDIYKNVILYAKWELKEFRIIYQLGGGSFIGDYNEYVVYDSTEALTVPEKLGYKFLGWYTNRNEQLTGDDGRPLAPWSITSDLTVVAKWDYEDYLLTYDANGGTVEQPTLTVEYNNNFIAAIPVKNGYEFEGWALKLANGGIGEFLTFSNGASINAWLFTDDKNVVAVWSGRRYNAVITHELGEGVSVSTNVVQVTYNEHFTLPVPVGKAGFLGWFDGEGGTGTQYTDATGKSVRKWDVTGNIMFYPQWPTDIYTYADLNAMRDAPEKGYILKNDIEIPAETYWVPISEFTGILDGNGFSINNLIINSAIDVTYGGSDVLAAGLIAVNKGTVKNLKIGVTYVDDEADYTNKAALSVEVNGRAYIGGVAAINTENAVISNCEIAVVISVVSTSSHTVSIGAVAGCNKGAVQNVKLTTQINTQKNDGTLTEGTLVGEHLSGGVIDGSYFVRYNDGQSSTKPFGNQGLGGTGTYVSTTGEVLDAIWED